jgi:serine/threonine protein phosphatase PrpC
MLRDNPRELTLTVHHRSDAGRVRDHNEDYLGYRQPEEPELRAETGWLYAVADGVGGARAGEVASKLAVQTLLAAYYRSYQETPADRLREAFAEANHAVHERASEQEGSHRMSTTLVAAAIRDQELTTANVGDSRAYLIHEGQIRQITHDHSVVARLVAEGVITPEQAESHPRRHIISRSWPPCKTRIPKPVCSAWWTWPTSEVAQTTLPCWSSVLCGSEKTACRPWRCPRKRKGRLSPGGLAGRGSVS